MTKTVSQFAAIAAAVLLTLVTFQQAISVPGAAPRPFSTVVLA